MRLRAVMIAFAMVLGGSFTMPSSFAEGRRAADFSIYRTYTWAPRPPSDDIDPETYQKVRASIDKMLIARGYRREEPADFAVAFTIDLREYFESGSDPSYALDRPLPVLNPALRKRVTEGVLAIDFFDVPTRKRVWKSKASEDVSPGIADQRQIDRIVGKALKRVPEASQ